jgi:hypothetical protein
MKLQLRKFDPDGMMPRDGRIILVIGRRGSGKSTLIRDLMFRLHKRFDFGIGMSPTRTSTEMMEEHLPNAFVFDDGFNPEQFQKILAILSLLAKKHKLRNALVILDDCNANKNDFRSKTMRDVFMNGRHYGENLLWAMHYCMDILPDLRAQVDYVFVLKDNIRKNKERLYNNFFGMFEKLEDFIKVMDQCTENNECLVLDNTTPNPDPQRCLFWYKAIRDPPPVQIGRPVFYQLSDYYRRAAEDMEQDDMLKVHIRPGQTTTTVVKPTFSNANNPRIECIEKHEE